LMGHSHAKHRVMLALTLAAARATAGELPCSCAHVDAELASIRKELTELRDLVHGEEPRTGASAIASPEGKATPRRLGHGSSTHYVAVNALQVHEFSGTCQPGTNAKLLSKSRASGTPNYTPSLNDASSDIVFVSVTDRSTAPWTTSTIQTMPSPFKVVHDATCTANPTLDLPLSTTVQTLAVSGTLTVAGIEVGARLTALGGSWDYIPLADTTAWINRAEQAKYLVRDGLVFLRGGIAKQGVGDANIDDAFGRFPVGARPVQTTVLIVAVMSNTNFVRIQIAPDGWMTYKGGGATNHFYLDGVFFATSG